MMLGEAPVPAVRLADLLDALEFVIVSQPDENEAWLCKASGRILLVSESLDLDEVLPEDPEAAGYLAIPPRRYLDLGKPLAISFVDAELPAHAAQARSSSGGRGLTVTSSASSNLKARWKNGMTMRGGQRATRCADGARKSA